MVFLLLFSCCFVMCCRCLEDMGTQEAWFSLIAFIVAFWPVWGWLTIPGIMVLFFGLLHLAHFVPA